MVKKTKEKEGRGMDIEMSKSTFIYNTGLTLKRQQNVNYDSGFRFLSLRIHGV